MDLVKYFISTCYSYKYTKAFNIKYQGLLYPLLVPIWWWADITIDFIIDLPPCKRYSCTYKNILIIIYQLIKECHYVLTKGVAVSNITNIFLCKVYQLYRLFDLIIFN